MELITVEGVVGRVIGELLTDIRFALASVEQNHLTFNHAQYQRGEINEKIYMLTGKRVYFDFDFFFHPEMMVERLTELQNALLRGENDGK
jgi:hypothetical protein